jgi:hypothetical protein
MRKLLRAEGGGKAKICLVETTVNYNMDGRNLENLGKRWFWIELEEFVDFQEFILMLYLLVEIPYFSANLV